MKAWTLLKIIFLWWSIKNGADSEWETLLGTSTVTGHSFCKHLILMSFFKISASWTRGRVLPVPPSCSRFSPDSSLTKTAFFWPPSLRFALSSPLCFLPLEPIHWLEQRLTESSLITMTQNPACFDLQHKHAPPAGWFRSCRLCQLPFFFLFPPWLTCVMQWFEKCACESFANAHWGCINAGIFYLNFLNMGFSTEFFKWLLGIDHMTSSHSANNLDHCIAQYGL